MHRALDRGVNFFDTADVYGDGRSERLLARLRKERKEPFYITTKAGRRLPKQTVEGYSQKNLTRSSIAACKNLAVETIDLLQLHCPPTDAFYHPEVFEHPRRPGEGRQDSASTASASSASKRRSRRSSTRACSRCRSSTTCSGSARRDLFLDEARRRKVGVLARLPLSSGMLAGKMTRASKFADDDHRSFNREGRALDKGETFSGVPFEVGLEAVEELRRLVPAGGQAWRAFALRWILMNEAVTCVIPGAKRPAQVDENCAAGDLPALSDETMAKVREIYERRIKEYVHRYW